MPTRFWLTDPTLETGGKQKKQVGNKTGNPIDGQNEIR